MSEPFTIRYQGVRLHLQMLHGPIESYRQRKQSRSRAKITAPTTISRPDAELDELFRAKSEHTVRRSFQSTADTQAIFNEVNDANISVVMVP